MATNNLTNIAIAALLLFAALLACADCEDFGAFLIAKVIALGLGYAGVKLYKYTNFYGNREEKERV